MIARFGVWYVQYDDEDRVKCFGWERVHALLTMSGLSRITDGQNRHFALNLNASTPPDI